MLIMFSAFVSSIAILCIHPCAYTHTYINMLWTLWHCPNRVPFLLQPPYPTYIFNPERPYCSAEATSHNRLRGREEEGGAGSTAGKGQGTRQVEELLQRSRYAQGECLRARTKAAVLRGKGLRQLRSRAHTLTEPWSTFIFLHPVSSTKVSSS